jgi:hypothetical protein
MGQGGVGNLDPKPFPSTPPKKISPQASMSPSPFSSPLGSVTTRAVTPPKTQPIPVSGSVGVTMGLLIAGAFFVVMGFWKYWRNLLTENDC